MSPNGLCELVTGDSSYSVKWVVNTAHEMTGFYNSADITINPANGDIYLQTGNSDLNKLYLKKFELGSSSTTIVATLAHPFDEMKFNRNNNRLYGLEYAYPDINFVRIDPASGKMDILSPVHEPIMDGFLSAALDPVSNTYIYSASFPNANGYEAQLLYRRDMSGNVVHVDTTATFYQGLDVEY